MKNKNRFDDIDILRGIGIIIMVMGHVGFSGIFDVWIHSYHMPLFFVISGYFFKITESFSIKSLVYKKFKSLIVPYLSFGLLHYFLWLIFFMDSESVWYAPLLRLFTFNTEKLPIAGALWFFTALFFCEIFYNFIVYYVKKSIVADFVILVLSLGTSLITTLTEFRLPLTIDIALSCLIYYHIGRYLRKVTDNFELREKCKNHCVKTIVVAVALMIVNIVLSFCNGYVNIKMGWHAVIPLTWINALIGISSLYLCSVFIDHKVKYIKEILVFIGRNSIVYLCLNQLIIMLLIKLIGAPIGNMGTITPHLMLISIVILVLSMILLSILVVIFNKTKLRFMIGK